MKATWACTVYIHQSFCADLCDMNVKVAALLCITHIPNVLVTVPRHCLIPFATSRQFIHPRTTSTGGEEEESGFLGSVRKI